MYLGSSVCPVDVFLWNAMCTHAPERERERGGGKKPNAVICVTTSFLAYPPPAYHCIPPVSLWCLFHMILSYHHPPATRKACTNNIPETKDLHNYIADTGLSWDYWFHGNSLLLFLVKRQFLCDMHSLMSVRLLMYLFMNDCLPRSLFAVVI